LIGANTVIGISTIAIEATIGTAIGACLASPLEVFSFGHWSGEGKIILGHVDLKAEHKRRYDE
jgi:hypothetical protein